MVTRVTCPHCGHKPFRKESGLAWHLERRHAKAQVEDTDTPVEEATTPIPNEVSQTREVALKQELEDRLQQLERVTGLRESDFIEGLTDGTPLTEQLSRQAEQVTKLSDAVSKLSEAVEVTAVTKAMMDAQVEEFSKRLTDLREAHNRQAARIDEHRDTFNNNFTVLGSRIDKVQKMVEGLGESLSIVKTKQASHSHDGVSLIPKLDSKLQDLGTKMVELEAMVKNIKKRVPVTPYNFKKLKLTDGTEHTYTLYRGAWGLSRPQKIEDGEYIDLAEPED